MGLYTKIVDLQKLNIAWKKVWKNKPAAGVDNVTVEQFEKNIKLELKQLQLELINHTYKALPVKQVTLYKGEKARVIALYSMRDKVVQQSIAGELNKIYDDRFCSQTYAYRSNKSALVAINEICTQILTRQYNYYLKLDIHNFFDSIKWEILKNILNKTILEEDVIQVIWENSCSKYLNEKTGELEEKTVGIYQGSGLAPILSNIYLMEFDKWLFYKGVFFIRYSDDIIILSREKETLNNLFGEINLKLETLGLEINKDKSKLGIVSEGFDFLGYHFDNSGKSIPSKAEINLSERLENMWLTSGDIDFEDKIKKALEIIGGWEQYFVDKRPIGSIIEYVAVMYATINSVNNRNSIDNINRNSSEIILLKEIRPKLKNFFKDIKEYLISIWQKQNDLSMELLEFEQFFMDIDIDKYSINNDSEKQIENNTIHTNHNTAEKTSVKNVLYKQLIEYYKQFSVYEDTQIAIEIMQCYTDLGEYDKAQIWLDKKKLLDKCNIYDKNNTYDNSNILKEHNIKLDQKEFNFNSQTAQKILKTLVGREDIYGIETLDGGRKRQTETQTMPLTEQLILSHLQGNITLGTYVQRPNSTVKYIVFDVDVSKKIMLRYSIQTSEFKGYMKKAWQKSCDICSILENLGMKGYIEASGNRGYHIWLFFTEWIPVRYANMLCEVVEKKLNDTIKEKDIELKENYAEVKNEIDDKKDDLSESLNNNLT